MNNLAYREARVRVTDTIENTLYNLVKSEQDYSGKKKHTALWYREEVARALNLSETDNPSLRSYENELRLVRDKLKEKNPLDVPWTVGASLKYGISPQAISALLSMRKVSRGNLTIRRARWVSYLHSVPGFIQAIKEYHPDNVLRQYASLAFVAEGYAWREEVAELRGKDSPETSDLDELFLVDHDFSDDAIQAPFAARLNWLIGKKKIDAQLDVRPILNEFREMGEKESEAK